MLEELAQKLEQGLKGPLPGKEAHKKMSAAVRKPADFKFDWSDPPRLGAVLILLYPENGRIYLPLMRRSEYGGVHSGQISLPGGKMEKQDTDLVQTALREAQEEIGIPEGDVTILGKLTPLFVYASNFDILPVVGFIGSKPIFKPDEREVVEVISADLIDLANQEEVKTTELSVRNYIIEAPYYDINNQIVWGATAMILSEFLQVISSFPIPKT